MNGTPRPEQLEPEERLDSALAIAREHLQSSTLQVASIYWDAANLKREKTTSSLRLRPLAACLGALPLLAAIALLLVRAPNRSVDAEAESFAALAELEAGGHEDGQVSISGVGLLDLNGVEGFSFVELESERRLSLERGTLRAQIAPQDPERPVTIVTSELRIVVLGTRLDVLAQEGRTHVELLEGKIRLERGSRSATLHAGESIDSGDIRLLPLAFDSEASPARDALRLAPIAKAARPRLKPSLSASAKFRACERLDTPRLRIDCLTPISLGTNITAQSALYSIALQHKQIGERGDALGATARFEERFPSSFLAPEVSLLKLELIASERQREKAIVLCDEFLARFPDDPRNAEVAALRKELESSVATPSHH